MRLTFTLIALFTLICFAASIFEAKSDTLGSSMYLQGVEVSCQDLCK